MEDPIQELLSNYANSKCCTLAVYHALLMHSNYLHYIPFWRAWVHPIPSPGFYWCSFSVFSVVFCRILSVLLSLLFCLLYCFPLLDFRLLITHLKSPNFSGRSLFFFWSLCCVSSFGSHLLITPLLSSNFSSYLIYWRHQIIPL